MTEPWENEEVEGQEAAPVEGEEEVTEDAPEGEEVVADEEVADEE